MHRHQCRYCLNKYLCKESGSECFERYITCNECWFDHDLKHILLFVFLLAVALGATFYLFHVHQDTKEKPAFTTSPVSSTQH